MVIYTLSIYLLSNINSPSKDTASKTRSNNENIPPLGALGG